MRRTSVSVCIAICLAVSLLGCAKKQGAGGPKPGDFFPLALGYSWEYEGEGNEYAAFSRTVMYSKNELYQLREDNGGTVSASVYKVTSDAVTRVFFQGEDYGDENYLDGEQSEGLIILKAPLEVGTKWSDPNGTREIVSVTESVSTPSGEYADCVQVKIVSEDSTVNEYFKDGVGLVKREFISGQTKITSSLKKFSK